MWRQGGRRCWCRDPVPGAMRRRHRRWLLLICVAGLLLLLASTANLSWLRPGSLARRLQRTLARSFKHPHRPSSKQIIGAIRSRQALLPILTRELSNLKQLPLTSWTEHQRSLLNMTFRPWDSRVGGSSCGEYKNSFTQFQPPMALVSFPGSGNSWLRYLIEGATGMFTGSMYADLTLLREGMYGEAVPFDCGCTLTQKTHGFTVEAGVLAPRQQQRSRYSHVSEFGCRGVLLLREPLQALVSHRHLDTAGHLGYAPSVQFTGADWEYFVETKSRLWYDLYADWLDQCSGGQLTVVHYRRLREDPAGQLTRLLDFLGVAADPGRLKCLFQNLDGRMQRKKHKQQYAADLLQDPFTEEQKAFVRQLEARLNQKLRQHGFEPAPDPS